MAQSFFTPPTIPYVPMALKPSHPAFDLFKFYRPLDAGINVFIVGGVVTTQEPDYEFVTPQSVFLGGHVSPVTDAEATLLTAAGYTVVTV